MVQIFVSLIAFLGGLYVAYLNYYYKRVETYRDLVQNARIVFEKWEASKIGPGEYIHYEGMDPNFLTEIKRKAHEDFF